MQNRIKRPISVWIAQILMIFFTLFFLLSFILVFLLVVQNPNSVTLVGIIFGFIIYLVTICIFLFAFWGMAKRRSYGRWLCVISLSLILFFGVMGSMSRQSAPNGPFEYYEYENSTQAAAGLQAQIAIIALALALILTLSFSMRVKDFFDATAMADGHLFPENEKSADKMHDQDIQT